MVVKLSIAITEEQARWIAQAIDSGAYESVSELLREALRGWWAGYRHTAGDAAMRDPGALPAIGTPLGAGAERPVEALGDGLSLEALRAERQRRRAAQGTPPPEAPDEPSDA